MSLCLLQPALLLLKSNIYHRYNTAVAPHALRLQHLEWISHLSYKLHNFPVCSSSYILMTISQMSGAKASCYKPGMYCSPAESSYHTWISCRWSLLMRKMTSSQWHFSIPQAIPSMIRVFWWKFHLHSADLKFIWNTGVAFAEVGFDALETTFIPAKESSIDRKYESIIPNHSNITKWCDNHSLRGASIMELCSGYWIMGLSIWRWHGGYPASYLWCMHLDGIFLIICVSSLCHFIWLNGTFHSFSPSLYIAARDLRVRCDE